MAKAQILVVGDDPRMCAVAKDTLEAHGYGVPAVATKGEEAVQDIMRQHGGALGDGE